MIPLLNKSRWYIKILDYAEGDFERKVKETIRFENLKPSPIITRGFKFFGCSFFKNDRFCDITSVVLKEK